MVRRKTIDYVFPYVDCDDPSWIAEYNKYVPKEKEKRSNWSTGMQRFRANDLLKYVFRSIEKNMPFIRTVHLLVMSESQVPEWVDRTKVHVVLHKDFIPEEFLPTFNSNTIESFLGNIPGLSERFIYGNDDLFITSKCYEYDFFEMSVPKYKIRRRKVMPHAPGDQLRMDDQKLITGKDSKYVHEVQHICMPYCLSTIKEVFNRHHDKIMASIGKFREAGQYNQWIFSLYQHLRKKHKNLGIRYFSTEIKPSTRAIYNCDWTEYKAICLNDSSETTQTDLEIVRKKLDKMFPKPCKFEKKLQEEPKKVEKKVEPVKTDGKQNRIENTVMVRRKKNSVAGKPSGKAWNEFFGI